MSVIPCCLTIAGSDSGGNAGVQADLRVFHSYRIHACTVFSALTAQNPDGVHAVHPLPAGFVAAQLDAVLGGYAIAALKTGMLSGSDIVETVADRLRPHPEIAKVVDPVMVATSGARLIAGDAVETVKRELLPLATVVTPNIPEAELLCGIGISRRQDMHEAARRLFGEFGCSVLVKGGHARNGALAEDVFFDGREFCSLCLPWVENAVSVHGSGCSLAAALAAELALGSKMSDAVAGAKRHVRDAIAASYLTGEKFGVLGWAAGKRHRTTRRKKWKKQLPER